MATLRNKKTLKLDCFLAKVRASRHIIGAVYHRLSFKTIKNLRCSFKATAVAADKGKLYSVFSMPEISERKFCDDLEMKFTSPLQQTGAPETDAKSLTHCFYFRLVIASACIHACISC